ncbi:hypothetical protein F2Q68_00020415 [Brassica cretica]|nr:hypothetical protein F2Q68_00020415 [Brassica cretica]
MSFGCVVVAQAFLGHNSEMGLAAYALLQRTFICFIYDVMLYRVPRTWTTRRMMRAGGDGENTSRTVSSHHHGRGGCWILERVISLHYRGRRRQI